MKLNIIILSLFSCLLLFVSLLLKETWHFLEIIDLKGFTAGNGAVPGLENVATIFFMMLFYGSLIIVSAISIKVVKNSWKVAENPVKYF